MLVIARERKKSFRVVTRICRVAPLLAMNPAGVDSGESTRGDADKSRRAALV